MLGSKASFVGLTSDSGNALNLADYAGKNIVLYFYPKDDTPGCTLEAKDFNEHLKGFVDLNTVVIGVSKDEKDSHEKFKKKHCLSFMLASDLDGKACENYGVWGEKSMYGKKYMGVARTTFIINKNGKIAKVFEKVKPQAHEKEIMAALKNLDS